MDNNTLKKLQQTELKILKEISAYCKLNKIHYSLYGGTALGAIRHQGFIPWDDDIDIVMTRNNYNKFIEKWNQEPLNGYHLQSSISDINSGICHTKIRKDDTILLSKGEDKEKGHHGIWIDIFVWDKIPKKGLGKYRVYWNGLLCVLLTRGNSYNTEDSWQKKIIKTILARIPVNFRRKMLLRAVKGTQCYNKLKHGYEWVDLSAVQYFSMHYPVLLTHSITNVIFENAKFEIFKDYNTLLQIEFGNYMELPPVEQRVCTHSPIEIEF